MMYLNLCTAFFKVENPVFIRFSRARGLDVMMKSFLLFSSLYNLTVVYHGFF